MNKLMIVLGVLLIAGLSFAELGWQYPWQQYVFERYECHAGPMGEGHLWLAGEYMQPYASPSELYAMEGYLYNMEEHLFGMAFGYYAAPFRAEMAGYNTDYSAFNLIFNGILREYFAAGGDRALISYWLNDMSQSYRSCLIGEPYITAI